MTKEDKWIEEILTELERLYPNPRPALNFSNSFELLVAVALSAQCTDERVNKVTSRLFQKVKEPKDLAFADQGQLADEIRECGLFRNKSKNLKLMGQMLMDKWDGKIPEARQELEQLPGVGRKTANVVISNAFGIPAIAVDTHVHRVANRLKLAKSNNVEETEKQLEVVIPREKWTNAHHWLIFHGRNVCKARKPECEQCTISHLCPSSQLPDTVLHPL
ncbi:endonuclease-3 [Desulfitispora alkaliphila]|uniref:endonuclease III n=1 Tax=Desulfitispora alkaliphila TaxID=622674 RepID=UPI003D233E5F